MSLKTRASGVTVAARRCEAKTHLVLVTLALAVMVSAPLLAHRPGEDYIFIYRDQSALGGRIEFTLEDLDRGVSLDRDGAVSETEFEAGYEAYVRERVLLGTASIDYALEFVSHDVETYPVGRFARLHFVIPGLSAPPEPRRTSSSNPVGTLAPTRVCARSRPSATTAVICLLRASRAKLSSSSASMLLTSRRMSYSQRSRVVLR